MGLITKSIDAVKSGAESVSNKYSSAKQGIANDIDAVKTGFHYTKKGAVFLGTNAVKGAGTVQSLVRLGAEKANGLFSKMKDFYNKNVNTVLSEQDIDALKQKREILKTSLTNEPIQQLKDNTTETIKRIDEILKKKTIRTSDVHYAIYPLNKGLFPFNKFYMKTNYAEPKTQQQETEKDSIMDAEYKQIEPLSKDEIQGLANEMDHFRDLANHYENMPKEDKEMLGLSDEKLAELTSAYRKSAEQINKLIVHYAKGRPVMPEEIDQAMKPLNSIRPQKEDKTIMDAKFEPALTEQEINNLSMQAKKFHDFVDTTRNIPKEELESLEAHGLSRQKLKEIADTYEDAAINLDGLVEKSKTGEPVFLKDVVDATDMLFNFNHKGDKEVFHKHEKETDKTQDQKHESKPEKEHDKNTEKEPDKSFEKESDIKAEKEPDKKNEKDSDKTYGKNPENASEKIARKEESKENSEPKIERPLGIENVKKIKSVDDLVKIAKSEKSKNQEVAENSKTQTRNRDR